MRARGGSVTLDKRIKAWNFFWWADGKRHSKTVGTLRDYPTKTAAWKAAKPLRDAVENQSKVTDTAPMVNTLVEQYRTEKMPQRLDTNRGYESWIRVHILPKWGQNLITDLQARPVEMWLESLPLAPKSRTHIRGIISSLWNFAMWKQDIPTQVNPIGLVTVKGASKRIRQPRSLTVEQFRLLVSHLREPFGTMALVCICFGLRISECLALRWSDVDWLNGLLRVERGIVEQNVDDVKTDESRKSLAVANELARPIESVEAEHGVSSGRRLDFRQSSETRQTALLVHRILARARSGWQGIGHRSHRHPHVPALVPDVDRRGRYSNRRPTEAHAARRHSHHHEHLRGCGISGHA